MVMERKKKGGKEEKPTFTWAGGEERKKAERRTGARALSFPGRSPHIYARLCMTHAPCEKARCRKYSDKKKKREENSERGIE